jgi:hypothetical protein
MLAPAFGMIYMFLILGACSALFACTSVVFYLLRQHKAGRASGILATISFVLFLFVYWEIYGFTWFG